MAAAKRFEELIIWQRARQFANLIYTLTSLPSFKDAALRNQMRRAAVSVMSNIAEGFGRGANEEFLRFLFIAKGSATEVLSQLYLASDLKYISPDQFHSAQTLGEQTAVMIQILCQIPKIRRPRQLPPPPPANPLARSRREGNERNPRRSRQTREAVSALWGLRTGYRVPRTQPATKFSLRSRN